MKKMNVDTKRKRRWANQVNKDGMQVPDGVCVALQSAVSFYGYSPGADIRKVMQIYNGVLYFLCHW